MDLFGSQPPKQAAGAPDPRIHICRACGKPGASCGIGEAFYCPKPCAPADFFPHTRGAA